MSEAEILGFLTTLFQTSIYESIASGILYGVYVVSYIASTSVLFSQRKALKLRSLWFMLSITAFMFILGTVAFALSVCLSQQQLPQLLNLVELEWSLHSLDVAADIFAVITRLNPILSDIVCAWRAVILWHSDRRVVALLTAIILGTTGAAGYDLSLALVTTSGHSSDANLDPEQGKVALVFVAPMLGTNIISTGLIGWKAWEHRKAVQTLSNKGDGAGRVERVLALLIESGAVYCLLWAVYLLTAFKVLPGAGSLIVNTVMIYVSSIYPTLITILVGLQRSQCERYATISRNMEFVRATAPDDERVMPAIRRESIMLVSVSDFEATEGGAS